MRGPSDSDKGCAANAFETSPCAPKTSLSFSPWDGLPRQARPKPPHRGFPRFRLTLSDSHLLQALKSCPRRLFRRNLRHHPRPKPPYSVPPSRRSALNTSPSAPETSPSNACSPPSASKTSLPASKTSVSDRCPEAADFLFMKPRPSGRRCARNTSLPRVRGRSAGAKAG